MTKKKRKIIFLDVDGVLNNEHTAIRARRSNGVIGIDPYLVHYLNRIIAATDAEIVLSSTWRYGEETFNEVQQAIVHPIISKTGRCCAGVRGAEIQQWIYENIEYDDRDDLVYAILDDDCDMLITQMPNFFNTTWQEGLTEEIADEVIKHLNQYD